MYYYSPCPQPCSRPLPTHAFTREFWTPTGKSAVGSLFLSPGSWCTRFCCALQESISQSYVSGVNGDFLQEHLCHTQVYYIQSPCPLSSPLLTRTSSRDTQTQFYLSLCGVSASWCTQGMFKPFEYLWWAQGLILNTILPLLLSCWGFSFALECGVAPHSNSSATQLPLQSR